jgi:hypothetical protein
MLILVPPAVIVTGRREAKRFRPITITDLVAAARTGRWPLIYADRPSAGPSHVSGENTCA